MRELWRRIEARLRWRSVARDLEEELPFHIDMKVRETGDEVAARRALGSVLLVREHAQDAWGWRWLDDLLWDVRYALRQLRQNPGFTAVAVLTLAIGIGINAAVFTVTNATLFKGFRSVTNNDRILYIGTQRNGRGCCASYPDFLDWRAQATSFTDMAAVSDLQIAVTDESGDAEHYDATLITTNAFHLLGQGPAIGRDFTASDGAAGAAPVAILRYAFWERRFGKDPAVIEQTIRINGRPTTIIGVMPSGFSFPQNQDLWLPLAPTPDLDRRDTRGLWFAFGRMTESATFESARAELATIGGRLAAAYPRTNQGWTPEPRTFAGFFIGPDAPLIYGALWGAVGFVLLIACANLANLMLARAIGRAREIAVRVALGAGRCRIVRQLLAESLLLASLGGAAGWWIAKWGVRVYALTANPPTRGWSDHLLDYTLDGRVLAYLVAISTATAVLLALAPMAYLSTLDINVTLKGGGRGATGGGRHPSLSRLLVIVEMALAVVLLAGAGSMVRSFLNLSMADLGVHTTDVTTMLLNLPKDRYRESTAQIAFFDRLKLRLESIPGIDAIAIASELPAATLRQIPYEIAGAPAVDDERRPTVPSLTIGPGYFGTLAATVLSGRDFNDFDHLSGAPVAIVNQRFASTQWPGADPLGKRLRLFDRTTAGAWRTVVGVVSNVEQNARDRHARDPVVYQPYRQQQGWGQGMWVLVRSRTPAGSLATAFRRAVQAVDADLPIWIGPFALDSVLLSMGNYWSIGNDAALFVVFAAIALLLASIGLYAVIAHAVSQRTQEIGVRIAIGAGARDILALVLRQALLPIVIGLTIGLTAALGVTPMLKSELVDVSPTDPTTLIVAATVLAVAATLGCWIPARRALLVDPLVALRHD